MVPADSHRIPRVPRYSGYRYGRCRLRVQVSHLLRNDFPDISAHLHLSDIAVLQPRHCVATAPVWALPRSLATTGGIIVYFLFLEVLRCFSSLGSPHCFCSDDRTSYGRVVPFGNHRVNGYLRLTGAYRSLSRPSSPL